ncbi:helix-turn-helix domain-containing protein [Flavobacteriaceae bacterium AU392]|nr:AraC family transcriptional regulator [Flavobacteriaceae bacterium]RKM84142.1 helix-turn-helix domain-containing protein [Flavobacteriaceae bacterium AU392]
MNYKYTRFSDQSNFILTDFNCASFDQRLGTGDYYKIIWAKEQDIMIGIDGYHIILKKDHILFCTPLNMLRLEPYTKGAISYIFNREFYCIRDHDQEVSCNGFLFMGSSTPPIVKLTTKERKSFALLFDFFEEEFETKDHIQGEMLRVLLKRLLIKSVRLLKKVMPEPEIKQSNMDVIRKFNLLVEEYFREKHKVSDYAALLNKSPKSLSNLFLKYNNNNKSPLKVINERIILEAKRLLRFSDKTSKQIAFELGYTESTHFYKFFKKHMGVSVKTYKSQNF